MLILQISFIKTNLVPVCYHQNKIKAPGLDRISVIMFLKYPYSGKPLTIIVIKLLPDSCVISHICGSHHYNLDAQTQKAP